MLMVIMLIGFGLMGAVQDTATFGISLSVPAVYEVKIAKADAKMSDSLILQQRSTILSLHTVYRIQQHSICL